jgi:hypothetical protein
MRHALILAVAFVCLRSSVFAAPGTTLVSTNDVLMIGQCCTGVAGGNCTLMIGPLRAAGDIYAGEYATKVSPYFFKNEDGKLAIVITRDAIDRASRGLPVDITGTATENGKSRKTRRIDAVATPLDGRQGTLRLRFVADGREMVFDTHYKFVAPD